MNTYADRILEIVLLSVSIGLIIWVVKLYGLAYRDQLTGLWNGRYFFRNGQKMLDSYDINRIRPIVFFIDLDNLKSLNDNNSHKIGDLALKALANIIEDLFEEIGLVARRSGDEFLILYIANSDKDVRTALLSLQEKLKDFSAYDDVGEMFNFSATIGMQEISVGMTLKQAVNLADKKMLSNKRRRIADK